MTTGRWPTPGRAPGTHTVMIKKCDSPDCYINLIGEYTFFECFDEISTYAYGATGYAPPTVMLHLEVIMERWSHNTLKKLRSDWFELVKMWKEVGINDVLITKEGLLTDNQPWIKFLSVFGIAQPGQFMAVTHKI